MNKIGVFCSASGRIHSTYLQTATAFGNWLGTQGKTLVYGGSEQGIMGAVAHAVKANGGTVIGMVPTRLEALNMVNPDMDITFKTENLSDRKDLILNESDILVALPGGVGTLDEIFHVMASASIGYHCKQVVFFNQNGFWKPILRFLDSLEEQHFAHAPLCTYYQVADTLDELFTILSHS